MIYHPLETDSQPLRHAITRAHLADETDLVQSLLNITELDAVTLIKITDQARKLIINTRENIKNCGGIEAFMREYDLSSNEGISLMCLAEALLRIPDSDTANQLIKDKLAGAKWQKHLGHSQSLFVNASTWGLMLTGKLIQFKPDDISNVIHSLVTRSSEPVIRMAIQEAMRIIGQQFVMGETIEKALQRCQTEENSQYRYSFDMLGEAALTRHDAEYYFERYLNAIEIISASITNVQSVIENPGISIKLSALHPRFEFSQRKRVINELVPKVLHLVRQAQNAGIAITIDAEEADRLGVTLDVFHAIYTDKALHDWQGFGLAVQAYQKRALPVIDWLEDLAIKQKRRIMLRLVKGAYWDSEIKIAQTLGLDDYPVFTRKASTDLSYLACIRKICSAGRAFYPQFATHNAYTIASISEIMPSGSEYEFQRLHGMGNAIYNELLKTRPATACRVYAPVGSHKDLLPYLVRRLLENGANTSFVNRIENDDLPVEKLTQDPASILKAEKCIPHPSIPRPEYLYADRWLNSKGLNLDNENTLLKLNKIFDEFSNQTWQAAPLIQGIRSEGEYREIISPVDKQLIGYVMETTTESIETALKISHSYAHKWASTSVESRTRLAENAADMLAEHLAELVYLCIREGGRCLKDALTEAREAIDSCRYYAWSARNTLTDKSLPGPTGESNSLGTHARGVIVCISPWNFPAAIFTSQIIAALVAGNTVIAKPAHQTPLTAMRIIELLHKAGIPVNALTLLPGKSALIGPPLLADKRISGVIFTGSTTAAQQINQTLASRPGAILPLIAETGGQNAMIVDSSALPEQVVTDVISSAFNSAGQRCSALRVLFLQDDIAARIIDLIKGAMQELIIGNPINLSTDIGPMIDKVSMEKILTHISSMNESENIIYQTNLNESNLAGHYMVPTIIEIQSLAELRHEVFGPVLHIIRYAADDLDEIINAINDTDYGLTLGIHSRIENRVNYIIERVHVGNIYVNRDMIGAVVGVQPFGGENMSGTGPKAGGPNYLQRLVHERTVTINTSAVGGNASLLNLD